MAKHYRLVGVSTEVSCPRCGQLAEIREHKEIKAKQLKQPFYYSKWFNCANKNCATNIFMLEKYKVMNKNAAALQMKEREEYNEQLSFLRSI